MNDVKTFWDQQAKEDGAEATSPDVFYRNYEIKRILEWIPEDKGVLDIGCGNGYSTCIFAQSRPGANFIGFDYSQEMVDAARARIEILKLSNVAFGVHDVRQRITTVSPDVVISERCLINLASWEEQKIAIEHIHNILPKKGRLILVENTLNGLARLNEIRAGFGLHEIKMRWHNQYFDQDRLEEFLISKFRSIHIENIGNLYYLISRLLYAKMANMKGEEPRYNHVINKIAAQLPPVDGPYSPNMMYVLEKV